MKGKKQKLRRSQFVLVYGPGSIIEGPYGSRLIPSLKGLGEKNCNNDFFEKYEIKDVRMSKMLNDQNEMNNYEYHLLSIPSNDSRDEDETPVIYSTVMFPSWSLCYKRNPPILYRNNINKEKCDAFDEKECGFCDKENNPNVRFVRACPNGHLDEVYWDKEVHGDEDCVNSSFFYWKTKGSSLEDIVIECPKCPSSTTMQEIYKNKTKCTGRFPENEKLNNSKIYGYRIKYVDADRKYRCSEDMSVIQKQSSSLRIPKTKTLLKIPNFDDSFLNLFNNSQFNFYLDTIESFDPSSLSKEEFIRKIIRFLNDEELWNLNRFFETHSISDLIEEYRRIDDRDSSFTRSVDEEFQSIRSDKKISENYSRSEFVDYTLNCRNYDVPFPLSVCAIDKLTTVTAQISYERKPHPKKDKKSGEIIDSEQIYVGYLDNEVTPPRVWYPAFKGVGEGIFITSDENPFDYKDLGHTISQWSQFNANESKERPEIQNPLFVWWHTLSHAIMKSLSLFCGYSSASLRERIYLDKNNKGGILIYNTSPGDDGGMGGLIDLVSNKIEFDRVLDNAMDTLYVCSNDPLCSSVELDKMGVNGSACHNCLLVSETSCEHQNTLLDRNFFI